MAFWFAQRFSDDGAGSHKGFLMVVWFAKHFSHGCFGSRSGFLIAHRMNAKSVPTSAFLFRCFYKCAAHAGRETASAPGGWTVEVSPEIDLSS